MISTVKWLGAIAVTTVLLGCIAPGNWAISYDRLNGSVTRGWHVHDVSVHVAANKTVSDNNVYAPQADIVWHGDPQGNRREQVSKIIGQSFH